MNKQPIPSIKVILSYLDKIMMLKLNEDDKTVYDLPGGRMEYGEGIFQTLRREIKEEIGIDIKFETEPKLLQVHDYLHQGDMVHRLIVTFSYEVSELIKRPKGQGEANTEVVWLTKEGLNELELNPNYKKRLLSAYEIQ